MNIYEKIIIEITHVASPTKSSEDKVSLSMIFKRSSVTSSVTVNKKLSFHSGLTPCPGKMHVNIILLPAVTQMHAHNNFNP